MKKQGLICLAACVGLLAACGGDDDGGGGSAAAGDGGSSASEATTSTGAGSSAASQAPEPGGEPIVLGVVVDLTGANGASNSQAATVASAWGDWVNAEGGLNGQPVKVVVKDSKSSPPDAQAGVKDLVEGDGAVAVLFSDPFADVAAADYLLDHSVPAVSGFTSNDVWTTNPMYFPFALAQQYIGSATLDVAVKSGATVVGALVCSETPACEAGGASLVEGADAAGIATSPVVLASHTQPNYTAECLKLQEDDVDFAFLSLSETAALKIIDECAAQGFTPVWAPPSAVLSDSFLAVDGLHALSVQAVIPYFVDDARTADFRTAMEAYASGDQSVFSAAGMQAWVALEGFRAAVLGVPSVSGPADVLTGLYALSGSDLDGLVAQPLEFAEKEPGATSRVINCYYVAGIEDGKYTTPLGADALCVDG